jgi:hypothetical protein
MKKKLLSTALVLIGLTLCTVKTNAQITIGADRVPNATLEVVSGASNITADGIMLPRLTGNELKAKDNMYGTNQTSAMVYVTAPVTSPSAKTQNVTATGYYYFDGTEWQAVKGGGSATLIANNGLTKTVDSVQLGGTLTKDTEIIQNNTKNLYTTGNGKVSVGAAPTANSAKFEVNGASANTQSYSTAGMSIDFTQSNLAYTTASAGAFTISGLKDGGTYTLAVKGTTSGTASFSQSGITFHIVNNAATTTGKHTLYTFIVMGADAYVWMTNGF